jgi:hypothetical protein
MMITQTLLPERFQDISNFDFSVLRGLLVITDVIFQPVHEGDLRRSQEVKEGNKATFAAASRMWLFLIPLISLSFFTAFIS